MYIIRYSINLKIKSFFEIKQDNPPKKRLMRYQLLILLLTIIYYAHAQEVELKNLNNKISRIDSLILSNEQKIKLIKDENNKLLNEKNQINSQRNEIMIKNEIGEVFICTMGGWIHEKPNGKEDLMYLKRGDKVKVLETKDQFVMILFNGIKGWIYKLGLVSETQWNLEIQQKEDAAKFAKIEKEEKEQFRIANNIQMEKDRKIAAEKQKIAAEKRKSDLIKKYGASNGLKIFEEKIWIGMTKEMLIESWGRPNDINRTVGSWGVHEQCIYSSAYIYIENGVVTSWQD